MALWLKAIPWSMLLRQAPTILAAADALLASSRRHPQPPAAASGDQALAQRLEQIEELQRTNADVVKQLADQMGALTAAAQVDAARTRLALTLGAVGVLLGAAAMLVAWLV